MAFVIKNIAGAEIQAIVSSLGGLLVRSRFTARIEYSYKRISIHDVRLKVTKGYCGNHPFACVVGGSHNKRNYLEGADWVGFNDLVNDVLDKLNVSADVASSLVVIRKKAMRCVKYRGHSLNELNNEWDKVGKYEDWRGKVAPRSQYPDGTPGDSSYLAND